MMIEWLQEPTTVEKAEQRNMAVLASLGSSPVPFGFLKDEWLRLKEQMRPGDELWQFRSPPKSWECDAGRVGLCILRNGKVAGSIVTESN